MTLRTIPFLLEPLDVLFFRDGRPFGESTRAAGGLPNPQILAGALTTALLAERGCRFDMLAAQLRTPGRTFADAVAECGGESSRWIAHLAFRGPWLARVPRLDVKTSIQQTEQRQPEIVWPAPANLHVPKKGEEGPSRLLTPLSNKTLLPGWKESLGGHSTRRPLWTASGDRTEPASGFLTTDAMQRILSGNGESLGEVSKLLLTPDSLFGYENRTGIGVDFDRLTAEESKIYSARFLRLRTNVADVTTTARYDVQFYGELVLPADAPAEPLSGLRTLAFGGEGRRVALHVAPAARPLNEPVANGTQRPCCYLTTPGLFENGTEPSSLRERLVSSAVPRSVAVSGWDLAKAGPKPNRFAADAGSVFFCDQLPADLPGSLCDGENDRRQGWGLYLKGVWTDE